MRDFGHYSLKLDWIACSEVHLLSYKKTNLILRENVKKITGMAIAKNPITLGLKRLKLSLKVSRKLSIPSMEDILTIDY